MIIWMGYVGGNYTQADWSLEDPVVGLRVVIRPVKFQQPTKTQPAVIMGLTHLDAGTEKNLRVRVEAVDITTTGFNAKFITWADSVTYGVMASWIAVG
jgi:hypothetical protein